VWDQQILLLWILLTPVFLGCGFLVFAARLFFRERRIQDPDNDALAEQPMKEIAERRAA
jgi:hypothetical protein